MRINKYLASRLGISRRKADEYITLHDITVNGVTPKAGQDISTTDTVLINGKPSPEQQGMAYVLLHKPVGYVCSRDGQGSETIYHLLPSEFKHLNPVGRLDKDSSGLLLLTNDGELHQKLTHPSYEKEKVYIVTLYKPLTTIDKNHIEKGVVLADGISRLAITLIRRDGKVWEVRMHEGRNRQIRRTFEKLGYKIVALHRTQFGNYSLGSLKPGEWSEL